MTKKAEFIIDETNSKEADDQEGKAVREEDMLNANSKLSVNRQSSIVSDSKLTQHYSQMWENEEDRQRVMARFRSFDMTGLTQFNSHNYRSPSQFTDHN